MLSWKWYTTTTYDQLHKLNEQIRLLKEPKEGGNKFDSNNAEAARKRLRESIIGLIALFDHEFPEIKRNFERE